MNFSFIRKSSSVFVTLDAYWTYALDACDFFRRSCVFSTSKGIMNDHVLGRFVTVEDGCMVPPKPQVE